MKQKGQVVIILLLVMVVALALGLSMIGRSTTEISSSTRTEDSSRAFSAAEAGIERALKVPAGNPVPQISLSNRSKTLDVASSSYPIAGTALRYRPFGKEAFAQFWLSKPEDLLSPGGTPGMDGFPDEGYNQSSFYIYFGDPTQNYSGTNQTERPAIEVHLVARSIDNYVSQRYFFDSYNGTNSGRSNFSGCNEFGSPTPLEIFVNDGIQKDSFFCKVQIGSYPSGTSTQYPIMARVRILYSNLQHQVALKPTASSLPAQANIYQATGTSGSVQRKLEVFKQKYVMPNYFDYVLFSAGQLNKSNL